MDDDGGMKSNEKCEKEKGGKLAPKSDYENNFLLKKEKDFVEH